MTSARIATIAALLAFLVAGVATGTELVLYVKSARWCTDGSTGVRRTEIVVTDSGKACRLYGAGEGERPVDVPISSPLPAAMLALTTLIAGAAWGVSMYANRNLPDSGRAPWGY